MPLSAAKVAAAVSIDALRDAAVAWHLDGARLRPRSALPELRPLRLLSDAPRPALPAVALVRSIVRSNHRIDPFDALVLATVAVRDARAHRLDAGFFGATILQESGFAPDVMSPAAAIGIGQFTLDTAATEGVDPYDWRDALRGSAALLGRYVNAYDGVYADPYAAALAAYNAGPGTVAYYHGVPPYAETRDYIADIVDRWSRILRDETRSPRKRAARRRR